MLRAIFWKEWRQQRLFLFPILILMPILVGVLLSIGGSFADERHPTSDVLATAALCVAILQAVVTGSLLFAGEVETGTLAFLDACSAERSRIWRAEDGVGAGDRAAGPALACPFRRPERMDVDRLRARDAAARSRGIRPSFGRRSGRSDSRSFSWWASASSSLCSLRYRGQWRLR